MSEDVSVEVEKLQALHEEKSFIGAKEKEDKQVSADEELKTKLGEKKTEQQQQKVAEGVNAINHLSRTVQIAWNMIAVPRGLEEITEQDRAILDESYKDLKPVNISPEGNALIGTFIVIAPKIMKGLQNKNVKPKSGVVDLNPELSKKEPTQPKPEEQDALQGLMTGKVVDFGSHAAIK